MNTLRSPGFMTVLVLLGMALRLWAYAANPSLWLDEILLSRNILELPLGTLLTQPLQLDQVAPRGFLLVEKVAVLLLGETELALRLFPFLCGIASVFLFRRLAERSMDWQPPLPWRSSPSGARSWRARGLDQALSSWVRPAWFSLALSRSFPDEARSSAAVVWSRPQGL